MLVLVICLSALLVTIFCEGYFTILEQRATLEQLHTAVGWNDLFLAFSAKQFVYLFVCFVIIGIIITFFRKHFCGFIYQYRYVIAGIVFIICIIFELNGSSIGKWQENISGTMHQSLIGIPRAIRSDEWATNSPMMLSQYYNLSGSFSYFGETLRGTTTDMFMVYGQPVKDVAVIFRPFHWGYLFLSPGKGLSFFWMGRLIALFLVTFEMGMLITKRNKTLACALAFLISWAPIVQWWFAVNSLVEMLVFGQLAILMIYNYIKTDNYKKRVLFMLVLVLCAGAYILSLYPAWQVSLGYVFLALFIWIILDNYKKIKWGKRDFFIFLVFLAVLALGLGYVFNKSWDTIQAVMNSAYPGKRLITGGGLSIKRLFDYPSGILYPLQEPTFNTNACEMATFYDFFPLGIILSFLVIFKQKKYDKLLICLLSTLCILLCFCFIQWPAFLAKITLLSYVPESRIMLAVGLLNTILLIRAMSLFELKLKIKTSILIVIVLSGIIICVVYSNLNWYLGFFRAGVISLVLASGIFSIFQCSTKKYKSIFLGISIFIAFMGGMFVNPVEVSGLESVYSTDIVQSIKKINDEEPGIWIVEGSYPYNNLPIIVGASTINSTNIYPDIVRWQNISDNPEDFEIYNRYAHIAIQLKIENKTSFELIQPDVFKVNLNVDDLRKMGVNYILTTDNLEKYNGNDIEFKEYYNSEKFNIYKIENKE